MLWSLPKSTKRFVCVFFSWRWWRHRTIAWSEAHNSIQSKETFPSFAASKSNVCNQARRLDYRLKSALWYFVMQTLAKCWHPSMLPACSRDQRRLRTFLLDHQAAATPTAPITSGLICQYKKQSNTWSLLNVFALSRWVSFSCAAVAFTIKYVYY